MKLHLLVKDEIETSEHTIDDATIPRAGMERTTKMTQFFLQMANVRRINIPNDVIKSA